MMNLNNEETSCHNRIGFSKILSTLWSNKKKRKTKKDSVNYPQMIETPKKFKIFNLGAENLITCFIRK